MTRFAVELQRTIAAPRGEVYRALVDPTLLLQWMVPPGCEGAEAVVEEHVGGRHRVEYRVPDGEQHVFDSVIRELVPDERVVLDFAFVGADPTKRLDDSVLTLTLRDAEQGGTDVRLVHSQLERVGPIDESSVSYGWNGALDKLTTLGERIGT